MWLVTNKQLPSFICWSHLVHSTASQMLSCWIESHILQLAIIVGHSFKRKETSFDQTGGWAHFQEPAVFQLVLGNSVDKHDLLSCPHAAVSICYSGSIHRQDHDNDHWGIWIWWDLPAGPGGSWYDLSRDWVCPHLLYSLDPISHPDAHSANELTGMIVMWLSCDCRVSHVIVMWLMWLSWDCHVTHVIVMWLLCDYHVTVMWLSCDCHVIVCIEYSYPRLPIWPGNGASIIWPSPYSLSNFPGWSGCRWHQRDSRSCCAKEACSTGMWKVCMVPIALSGIKARSNVVRTNWSAPCDTHVMFCD